MFKLNLLPAIFTFLFSIALDFILKGYYRTSSIAHFNRGFIFGSLQDLPPSLTLVTLTSVGAILIVMYLLFLFLLSAELKSLKISLSLFAGGILGNVLDRAIFGGTLDFIPLNLGSYFSVVFNPADLFQWIGAGGIFYNIIVNDNSIWYPENQRSLNLINKKEQFKFAFKCSLISFCSTFILGIFSISYLTLTLKNLNHFSSSEIIAYTFCFICLSIFFIFLSFMVGIVLSHRSVGPLYAFEKYVESLLIGERKDLKLREGDNYQHLIEVGDNLKQYFLKNDQN